MCIRDRTRADTGVGAAIAAASHEENGIWALFVNPAIIINVIIGLVIILSIKDIKFQDPKFIIHAINKRIITSPIRFISAVNIPAFQEFKFW